MIYPIMVVGLCLHVLLAPFWRDVYTAPRGERETMRKFMVYGWGHVVIFSEDQESDARDAFESACMVASLSGDEPSEVLRAGEIANPDDIDGAFMQSCRDHDVIVHRCDLGEPYPWDDAKINSELITTAATVLARMAPPVRRTYGMTEPFNPYGQGPPGIN
jgi:hypothetical protein